MSDPLIDRVVAMLNDAAMARIRFQYRQATVPGSIFPGLVSRLAPYELTPATGIRQPRGRFGILINPSHPSWREMNATAHYDSDENVLVLRNRLIGTPEGAANLFHELWHAHCDLSPLHMPVLDEELIAYVCGAAAESLFGPCTPPRPLRLVPTDCPSAARPLGRLIAERRGTGPLNITGDRLTTRLEAFVAHTYGSIAAANPGGMYDNDG